tara:strand:- start:99 stop:827 length:729 start_codon:yes stop_codon:yes gene_type:complete
LVRNRHTSNNINRQESSHISLDINKSIISIFASGTSVNTLSDNDIDYICSNTYTVGLNYASCKLKKLNQIFYIDKKVKDYLTQHSSNAIITTLFDRFLKEPFKNKYITDENAPEIFVNGSPWIRVRKYNLSIITILRMFREYYPDKKCLIFGLDLYNTDILKWYDKYIDEGRIVEERDKFNMSKSKVNKKTYPEIEYNRTTKELDKIKDAPLMGNLIFNANPDSKYEGFEKVEWKEFIETNK